MFKEKEEDGGDLRTELGLTEERADELVNIVNSMVDQETPYGKYGMTSRVLLNITGRKDLNDVEKATCVFIFCCNALSKRGKLRSGGRSKVSIPSEIEVCMQSRMPHGMSELKGTEFIDIEGGIAGMIVAPEGVDKLEMISVLMASVISLLRDISKQDAQHFCRTASMSFAKMALDGDIRQD